MSNKDEVYGITENRLDTEIFDTSQATYNYQGFAPRQEVLAAGGLAAAQALPIWFARRTTQASPHVTESASAKYDQVWDDVIAGTVTTWEGV